MAVYFAYDVDKRYIKIGKTIEPNKRIKTLNGSIPFDIEFYKIVHGDIKFEQSLHKKFNALRLKGEWFRYDKLILDYADSLPKYNIMEYNSLAISDDAYKVLGYLYGGQYNVKDYSKDSNNIWLNFSKSRFNLCLDDLVYSGLIKQNTIQEHRRKINIFVEITDTGIDYLLNSVNYEYLLEYYSPPIKPIRVPYNNPKM